ncbi:MAG: NAD-binding protein [Verrucomicrobiota bacterium]
MTASNPITIVGGGLAGLALGIALRRQQVPVSILEAGSYPRHRVCGEFIAGITQSEIRALGIDQCLADSLQLNKSTWFFEGAQVYQKPLPRTAIGISRYRLDQRMAETFVDLGGTLECHQRVNAPRDESGWVAAQGRVKADSDWIGLKIHCRDLKLSSDLELHLGNQAYVGLSIVESGRVNICGLFKQRSTRAVPKPERIIEYLKASNLTYLAEQIASGDPDDKSAVGVAGLSYAPTSFDQVGQEIRLGDQSGLIAPFTGNGMASALISAHLAVDPIGQYARGKTSWESACQTVNKALKQTFNTRRSIARHLQPWILQTGKQRMLARAAKSNLLPFKLLYQLTH